MGKLTKPDSLHSARNQVVSGDGRHLIKVEWAAVFGKDFMGQITQGTLAQKIDHTLLKPEATIEQIQKLCDEAKKMNFWSVCINPTYVSFAKDQLQGSEVKVCTVVGFPLGAHQGLVKAKEAELAVAEGATEIDMVLNIGALKNKNFELVFNDISAVVAAAQRNLVKVILETCLLSDEEKIKACELAKAAGAHFVKTSTGFSTGGATAEDIRLMRKTVGPTLGVKASGGIRDYETLIKMIEAGANRIGTSSGVALLSGSLGNEGY